MLTPCELIEDSLDNCSSTVVKKKSNKKKMNFSHLIKKMKRETLNPFIFA